MQNIHAKILELVQSGRRSALATVVRTSGSVPQTTGARLLMEAPGVTHGTVGGGAVELAVARELERCIRDGKSRLVKLDLGRDLGMCCGGQMEVFVESIEATPRLFLFGAGHVAQPTAQLARTVGYAITVIDDREELNTAERFPDCTRILMTPADSIRELGLRSDDWLLVMTHDHRLDEDALAVLLEQPHRYLGMIGSNRKVFRILARLHARKPTMPRMDRVYSPVGIDIGAVSPPEIAVSIVAELVALRHGATVPHMRAIEDPRLARILSLEETVEKGQ